LLETPPMCFCTTSLVAVASSKGSVITKVGRRLC
jgi:hypothetical protein